MIPILTRQRRKIKVSFPFLPLESSCASQLTHLYHDSATESCQYAVTARNEDDRTTARGIFSNLRTTFSCLQRLLARASSKTSLNDSHTLKLISKHSRRTLLSSDLSFRIRQARPQLQENQLASRAVSRSPRRKPRTAIRM